MVQITLIFIILLVIFVALRVLLGRRPLSIQQFMVIYTSVIMSAGLIFLGLTGKLNTLFAFLGATLPFIGRWLPWIARSAGMLGLAKRLRGLLGGSAWQSTASTPPASGRQSTVETPLLRMVLDHDSGEMTGDVVGGQFKGELLMDLNLAQLKLLFDECSTDQDSLNVLISFLDRQHPDWQTTFGDSATPRADTDLDEDRACEILGVSTGASRDQIVKAHRRLMQKFHPDRGGPTYLATQINLAKDYLLERL
ncbi:MAG: hypothetical protein ACJARY_000307 [Candidatus Azotimanducaceae bacterium]|jgi:hypothetical protein